MKIPLKTYLESVPGFFGIRTEEEPNFDVIEKRGGKFDEAGFQVRRYSQNVQAQTLVEGDRDHAVNEAFSRLAGYIFGENSANKTYSMTTPVLQGEERAGKSSQGGQTMDMTTPVLQEKKSGSWLVSFVLPSDVTETSAPTPNDKRVKITTVAPKLVATLRFTGSMDEDKMRMKATELLAILDKHHVSAKSQVTFAQYDQPFAIPFLKRNEAMVEINESSVLAGLN